MRLSKIASGAAYRMNKQFQNLSIFGISIVFQIEKHSENYLIYQIVKFLKIVNFSMRQISQISNLENSKKF